MKTLTFFLTLALIASLAGCQSGSRRANSQVDHGPAVVETATLFDGQIELRAEFGHRSRLLQESGQQIEGRSGDFGDRRRRTFPGSIQENYLRLEFDNISNRDVVLEIASVVTSMGRFSPLPRTLEIAAGESGRLTPFFFTYPRHYGDVKVNVSVTSDGRSDQAEMLLKQ